MFSKITVKQLTVDEWKNQMIIAADPADPSKGKRLGVSLQSLTESNSALFLLPITIDTIADDETRPNRNIALQALLHFAKVKSTGIQDLNDKADFLICVLGRIASMVGSRGNRSLEAQTKKLMSGSGYYARAYMDKGIAWNMSELMTTCNDFYSTINHVAVNKAAPPNWLGALAIVTRPSTFMYHILHDYHGTIPEALPPVFPFIDGTTLLFEVTAGSAKVLTKGVKNTRSVTGGGQTIGVTEYSVMDTWTVNVGVSMVKFDTDKDITSPQTVTPGSTITVKVILMSGVGTWPYSDEFMAAGAVPDETTFKWYFTHWWERNLEQRQKTLQVTDLVRQAALNASFTTHGMAWHLQVLVPAILGKISTSPFAVSPHNWKTVATGLRAAGSDFSLALMAGVSAPKGGTAPDYSEIRSLTRLILTSGKCTIEDVHDYGMYRKAVRGLKHIPQLAVPGWSKPEETLQTKVGALRLNSIVNTYVKPDTTDRKIVFGIVRVMPSAARHALDVGGQPKDDNYILPADLTEVDDVHLTKDDLHIAILANLWGIHPPTAGSVTDKDLDNYFNKQPPQRAIPAATAPTTRTASTKTFEAICEKWKVGDKTMKWQEGMPITTDDEIDILKLGVTSLPADQLRAILYTDAIAMAIRRKIIDQNKKTS